MDHAGILVVDDGPDVRRLLSDSLAARVILAVQRRMWDSPMMTKTLLLSLLAALVLAVPAHADWTDAERASLVKAHQAVAALTTDLSLNIVISNLVDSTTAERWQATATALHHHQTALRAVADGNAFLRNVNVSFVPGPAFLPLEDRADAAAKAWANHDRALEFLGHALRSIARIPCGADAACTSETATWIYQARVAEAALRAIDRTLAYASPYTAAFPQIVGPHGDEAGAQWHAWRSQIYWMETLDRLLAAYAGTFLPDSYVGLGRAWFDVLLIHGNVNRQAMRLARIVKSDGAPLDPATDARFFRVLDIVEDLITIHNGVAHLAHAWLGIEYQFWANKTGRGHAAFDNAVHSARTSSTDAWRHVDETAWRFMVFLSCEKLHNPAGCGGTGAR